MSRVKGENGPANAVWSPNSINNHLRFVIKESRNSLQYSGVFSHRINLCEYNPAIGCFRVYGILVYKSKVYNLWSFEFYKYNIVIKGQEVEGLLNGVKGELMSNHELLAG